MIVIGAVFLVLAALAAVVAVDTARDVNVHLSGFGVDATTTALWVFCAGAGTMLVLLLALAAFRRAARKSRARRRELRQLRSDEAAAARDVDLREREDGRADEVPAHSSPSAYVSGAEDGRERRYVADDEHY